jgi:hypothetical protein
MRQVARQGLAVLVCLAMVGCASVSSMQSARTIEKNSYRVTLAGGYVDSTILKTQLEEAKLKTGEDPTLYYGYPYVEGMFRYGLSNRSDLGMRYIAPASGAFDFKYMLVGGECKKIERKFRNKRTRKIVTRVTEECKKDGFALSVGPQLGFTYLNLVKSFEGMLPVYLGLDVSPNFGVYLVPKYVFRYATVVGTSSSWGSSIGLKLGNNWGLITEFTYLKALSSSDSAISFNGGLFF